MLKIENDENVLKKSFDLQETVTMLLIIICVYCIGVRKGFGSKALRDWYSRNDETM